MSKNNNFFPQKPNISPIIYAYSDIRYPNMLKVGYTTRSIEERMKEHYPTITPGEKPYTIEWIASAVRDDGSIFMDHEVHRVLKKHKVNNVAGEWFECDLNTVISAYQAVLNRVDNEENRTLNFKMRPEQERAVEKTYQYFSDIKKEKPGNSPKFLWNCKMRFGKTFATYELCKKMNLKRVLILTFKPAVESAWKEDLISHLDFEGWQFVSDKDAKNDNSRLDKDFNACDKSKPIVVFGSFQNLLGTNEAGGIKAKNEFIHETNWDMVVFDEYHYGAWTENAKKLFQRQDEEKEDVIVENGSELLDETWLPITANQYLYLSGTPFRAINSGEFIEEQVFNWTYSDEQSAKENWDNSKGKNPYISLPRVVLMTYKLPESVIKVARNSDLNEFELNEFFKAEGEKDGAHFIHENEVQKWLDIIRGDFSKVSLNDTKVTTKGQSYLPFKEVSLLNVLNHTLWYLPNVASCFAMKNLLMQNQNVFYHDYTINVCAGTGAGIGLDALKPVEESMRDPLNSKTITLTCGKLTTGVTVKPWTGIFMLRGLSSPESYFQSAFRVQSPWTMKDDNGNEIIVKKECYIFDFALNRALRQISEYATKLDVEETNPEKKVADFINFLPVLAYQDGAMQEINAGQILDIAMSGTTASLLARRWESALLVNVDNATLERLLHNERAMEVLSKIEGFRSLNNDISTIISKSEDVKKKKKEASDRPLSTTEKKELSESDKEAKSKRKQIQEKLIKFATRIPVFMYLTDYRENSLKDVITKLEPSLFKKVTGLDVADFDLLVSLGIFNETLMNDAVFKFRRYEDSSLEYIGINKHRGEKIGGYSTVITDEEYKMLYGEQQKTLEGFIAKPYQVKNNMPTQSNSIENSENKEQQSNVKTPIWKPTPKTENEKPKFVMPNVKVGDTVIHKAFGEGIIKAIDEQSRITIEFKDVTKVFGLEFAFEKGFIKLKEN